MIIERTRRKDAETKAEDYAKEIKEQARKRREQDKPRPLGTGGEEED
jgi:hypothetical protein